MTFAKTSSLKKSSFSWLAWWSDLQTETWVVKLVLATGKSLSRSSGLLYCNWMSPEHQAVWSGYGSGISDVQLHCSDQLLQPLTDPGARDHFTSWTEFISIRVTPTESRYFKGHYSPPDLKNTIGLCFADVCAAFQYCGPKLPRKVSKSYNVLGLVDVRALLIERTKFSVTSLERQCRHSVWWHRDYNSPVQNCYQPQTLENAARFRYILSNRIKNDVAGTCVMYS